MRMNIVPVVNVKMMVKCCICWRRCDSGGSVGEGLGCVGWQLYVNEVYLRTVSDAVLRDSLLAFTACFIRLYIH